MTRPEAETHLKNGGRLVSMKRLDEVYINEDKKVTIEFYQGNRLSGETMAFMWEFLPTFKIK